MSLKIKLKNRCNIFLNLKKTALSNREANYFGYK